MKYIFILIALLFASPVMANTDLEDGTYDATVTTSSGSYTVPVEVENGEVTAVEWANGGNMTVSGADIDGREASGYNSRGDNVDIEIDE